MKLPVFIVSLAFPHLEASAFLTGPPLKEQKHFPLFLQPQQLGSFRRIQRENDKRPLVRVENWLPRGLIPFEQAWNEQKERLQDHFVKDDQEDVNVANCVIVLEHCAVYTLGTGSDESYIISNDNSNNLIPVVRMDRGGEVTYHGPGQLVVYPILHLQRDFEPDLHGYIRALEQAVLQTLDKLLPNGQGVAHRDEETTGVWIENKKVAAIGIKCRQWVTQHGVAINVEEDSLKGFEGIVPCGLEGREVTCINRHLHSPITVSEFADLFVVELADVLSFVSCTNSETS